MAVLALLPAALGVVLVCGTFDLATSHVTIGPSSITLPAAGFPFRRHERIAFGEMAGVMVERESRVITFAKKDRTSVTIPMGDLVTTSLKRIADALETHDIPVADFGS